MDDAGREADDIEDERIRDAFGAMDVDDEVLASSGPPPGRVVEGGSCGRFGEPGPPGRGVDGVEGPVIPGVTLALRGRSLPISAMWTRPFEDKASPPRPGEMRQAPSL